MGQVSSQKSIFKLLKRTNRADGERSKINGKEGQGIFKNTSWYGFALAG